MEAVIENLDEEEKRNEELHRQVPNKSVGLKSSTRIGEQLWRLVYCEHTMRGKKMKHELGKKSYRTLEQAW